MPFPHETPMANALDRSRDALFVERLHAKTLARGLRWACGEHEGRYQVQLGQFLVEVGEGARGDPEILICDDDGRAIELLSPALLAENDNGPDVERARARAFDEIYEAARRMALGVDQVIDTLIVTLF